MPVSDGYSVLKVAKCIGTINLTDNHGAALRVVLFRSFLWNGDLNIGILSGDTVLLLWPDILQVMTLHGEKHQHVLGQQKLHEKNI